MPTPALQAAGAVVAGRDLLPRLLAALGAASVGLLLLVMAPLALGSSGTGAASAPVPDGIPAAFRPRYVVGCSEKPVSWACTEASTSQSTPNTRAASR